jgi:hypothetical protein
VDSNPFVFFLNVSYASAVRGNENGLCREGE